MTTKVEDEYRVTYQYVHLDGSLGTETTHQFPLYSMPTFLSTMAYHEAKIVITSCEKVSE